MKHRILATTIAVAAAALVACSTTSKGVPSPTTSVEASPSSSNGQAPPVAEAALDLSKHANNVCGILRAEQLSALGVTAGKQDNSPTGPSCSWKPIDSNGTAFDIALLSKVQGLDSVYSHRDDFRVFRPTQLAGYPAADTDDTDAAHGDCGTSVATANGAGFDVRVNVRSQQSPDYKNPCSVSEKIAQVVLGNLKGGG